MSARVQAGVGTLLIAAALLAALAQLAQRSEAEPAVAAAAARTALVGPAADRKSRRDPSARTAYWHGLASFLHSLAGGTRARPERRLRELRAAVERLQRATDEGPAAVRSRAFGLLALARIAQAGLDPARRGPYTDQALAALRRSVTLDGRNDDAKANLELLLQLRQREKRSSASTGAPRGSSQRKQSQTGTARGTGPATEGGAGY